MTNMRDLVGRTDGYWYFCREERNLAAVLYHLLLCRDNLQRFVDAVGYQMRLSDPAVYFEYALLRDLWFCLGGTDKRSEDLTHTNERKRRIILELLKPTDAERLAAMSVLEFNHHFGAGPAASQWCIQSPSTWSVGRFHQTIPDPSELLRTCMFKWAFNAKPDIVIHADADHALCIEAKLESGEGQYPASSNEKAIFEELGLSSVSQTRLQRYLMEDLLGIESDFLFLIPERIRHVTDHRIVTWAEAFAPLVLDDQPSMVNAWVKWVLGLG